MTPSNFVELVAGVSFLAGLGAMAFSFKESLRSHSTRLFALSLVATLALFANHWTVFFAAVFIVATAVTELEFLQNLAAIIRKDENYFKYRKEALSNEDVTKKTSSEVLEAEEATEKDASTRGKTEPQIIKIDEVNARDLSHRQRTRLYHIVEDKALSYLSTQLKRQIEKYVRFRTADTAVEFDGVISGSGVKPDILVEVKLAITPRNLYPIALMAARRMNEQALKYQEITGKIALSHLYVVSDASEQNLEERINRLRQRALSEHNVELHLLSFEQLGLSEIDLNA